jgi:hypothetical protein
MVRRPVKAGKSGLRAVTGALAGNGSGAGNSGAVSISGSSSVAAEAIGEGSCRQIRLIPKTVC